ncbi:MAG: ATP-binding protein [bacterium]
MYIPRLVQKNIEEKLFGGRILVLYGARRTGKTSIVKDILSKHPDNSFYFDFEDPQNRLLFENAGVEKLKTLLQDYKLVVFDEAQKFLNIGQTLKLIHDHLPSVQVIATGSSSFELSNKINEPLTGRKWEFKLFPLSVKEIKQAKNSIYVAQNIEQFLVYGTYPSLFDKSNNDKKEILEELANSYLFQDVFTFQDIRNPEVLEKLLRLLAFQVGNEVSYHELAISLKINEETVARYIQLLEKAFVIFRLTAFSNNPRKEISKTRKIYFYDLGIRNSLIASFNSLEIRNDIGALWENFCIVERMKRNESNQENVNSYFWRNYTQQEIDYIEESDGTLATFEFKYNSAKKAKIPAKFASTYPNHTFEVINIDNFTKFLT